jgi:hypothetical protein
VPIDLNHETLLPLSAAPSIPWMPRRRDGKPLNASTIYRWTTHGIRGHRLEYLQMGGVRITSHQALERFFARLGPADANAQPGRTGAEALAATA